MASRIDADKYVLNQGFSEVNFIMKLKTFGMEDIQ